MTEFNLKKPEEIRDQAFSYFEPPPRLSLSEWADTYRQLSPEASASVGQWRTSKTPYLREIMDIINDNQKVVVMSSSQIGKTEILLNVLGYFMHLDPCPMMLLEPTIEMAETVSKDRIAPMIRDTSVLTNLVGNRRSRDSENTILHKTFKGGHLTLAGANSSASLASRPIRNLLIDECDRFPFSAGREGDPIKLATKRTTTFWNRRIVNVSTPTIKGASRIEYEYGLTDKRKYFVPCPHCGEYQVLIWPQVKFEKITVDGKDEVTAAWYECEKCKGKITDAHRTEFLARGEWRPTAKARIPGFHIWQAYSPWSSFKEICQDFVDSKNNRELLKVWVNTCLGESFDEQGGEGLSWQSLLARCEPYAPLSVPAACFLTAGVDVQGDRLAVSVWGWGKGEEAWLIYTTELYGNPLQEEVWHQLDLVINSTYTHPSGTEFNISAVGIDTGFQSQVVYNYVRTRVNKCFAFKGSNMANKPVLSRPSLQEVTHRGKVLKRGVKLWTIGVSTVKSLIYNRLRLTNHGNGFIHFPIGTDQEFFEQLTAEKLITKFVKGFPKQEWIKTRNRNEALDCLVYAYSAALLAGLQRYDFSKLERELIPVEERGKDVKEVKPKINASESRNEWIPKRKGWIKG